jgi:predicted ArsR family transcriptional regulator
VVGYLSSQGYQASWIEDATGKGYILSTSNCPFEKIAASHDEVCTIDMHLVSKLLGVVPRRLGRVAEGDKSCTYFIRKAEESLRASQ